MNVKYVLETKIEESLKYIVKNIQNNFLIIKELVEDVNKIEKQRYKENNLSLKKEVEADQTSQLKNVIRIYLKKQIS